MNMTTRTRALRRLLATLALAAPLGLSSTVLAQDAPEAEAAATTPEAASTPEATAFVQRTSQAVLAIVNDAAAQGADDTRQAALRDAIRGFLSYDMLAQRTLGEHWEARTPEERAEFVGLLRDLIETSYSKRLGAGSVNQSDHTITYTGERERRGRVTVEASVGTGGEAYVLEIKMTQGDGTEWLVYDIVTDDVSLEESYYESFSNIIAEDGWDGLLNRMRERLTELRAG
ncbi:MAG: phospholipid transport system substrate-binding protein [Bradymonadia bacterium]|jgi:phospholipid transport system substrate-binding protein